ncbi:MAG: M3 family metallopeptidase [Burkholderiales bacterium]|nr:M3 family metallopeptidase [Burkholderiales bacterium]MDE1927826.1 M3 family metallopeptidase [Burkholderiales bacterium]MDE2502782.1 M3 family metallopeptidase [Burkholderiales bacterium]
MSSLEANPLLADSPDYAAIRPEHVAPAIDHLLAAADAALERAVGPEVAADYDALALALDVPVERLQRTWGHVRHLQAVVDTPALRAAHAEALPRVVDFMTRLGADARLYAKYKALAASPAAAALSPARRQVLAHALRDFVLGGAELEGPARARHAAIQDRMATLSQQFGDHVLDATDAYALDVGAERLAGVPDDVQRAARDAAAAAGVAGHRLTLQLPCYLPLMRHADDRELRATLLRAYATRASEFGPPAQDNSAAMRELLALRQEEAALIGYPDYATFALAPKMARSPRAVLDFVRDLARRARPHAEREVAELAAFAATELGLPGLQAWDRAYASEKLKQARYRFSGEDVKPYLTEPRVLQGLFGLVQTLFGVAIRPATAPVWHPSVRYFEVLRGGAPVAAFYLDTYARAGKQAGAWMDDCRGRWRRPEGGLQLPVAHLICNFAPPIEGRPALLTHDDLITLFHEFGHGLHHMLTQVDEIGVAGIAGVEGDAVELPSQFMENYCWEWEVLRGLSCHVDTGEPLPRDLYDRMIAARHFQTGLRLLRQCEYALFDMRLHAEPAAAERVLAIQSEVQAEIQVVAAPPFDRYAHSFGHLFDGGYAAGYYGYAWAEVLSADAYAAFEEAGLLDPATGARYRDQILAVGGSRPALESFIAFRGRAPSHEALLRHQGLSERRP